MVLVFCRGVCRAMAFVCIFAHACVSHETRAQPIYVLLYSADCQVF